MPHAISISLGRLRCRYYAGNIEYLNGQIQHIAFPDGRLVAEYNTSGASVTGYRTEYFRTDHLGNTRLTFSDFNQDGLISWKLPADGPAAQESEITSENHYYPFGLGQKGPWYASVAPENKYRYNGKEWNDEWGLNMYDYGARGYMPDLGRWGGVDALAERYYAWSGYNYVMGNPINAIDPDGRIVIGLDKHSQERIIGYLNDILGNGHGFSFNKKGHLTFKKKDVAEGNEDSYSQDHKDIISGIKEVIKDKNTIIYTKVSEDENVDVDISTPDKSFRYARDKIEKSTDGDYQGGIFEEIGIPIGGIRYAALLINRKDANKSMDAMHGGKTSPCESCTFIHELLDHGLYFSRHGVGEYQYGPNEFFIKKENEVLYNNKALKIKGSKIRSGRDHGVKH